MAIVLGIDLGTQSVKAALTDTDEGIVATAGKEYPVLIPAPGQAEESPEVWWDSLLLVLSQLKEKAPAAYGAISGIGITGQMHGLVMLSEDGAPVYPAIIWLDQRSGEQVRQVYELMGERTLAEHLQNRIFPGFALPSLMWVRENQPEVYRLVRHVISPKDYLRLRLTGEVGCERTDASATSMYDISENGWYNAMLEAVGLDPFRLPEVSLSGDIAGQVTKSVHELTGLPEGIPVIYGCGDESALLLGNGLTKPGPIVANIGTGMTVSAYSPHDRYDPLLRTQTFCNAIDDSYAVFGAMLGGGINMRWLRDSVLSVESYDALSQLAADVTTGAEGLLFLPYTSGERTPHMDADATGMFFGVRLVHDRRHLARAVMEGICFAMRDSAELLQDIGIPVEDVIASGGGARSGVWMQIMADVLNRKIRVTAEAEQGALGVSILAAASTGGFADVREGCERLVHFSDTVYEPVPQNAEKYNELYEIYKDLYRQTGSLMHRVVHLSSSAG